MADNRHTIVYPDWDALVRRAGERGIAERGRAYSVSEFIRRAVAFYEEALQPIRSRDDIATLASALIGDLTEPATEDAYNVRGNVGIETPAAPRAPEHHRRDAGSRQAEGEGRQADTDSTTEGRGFTGAHEEGSQGGGTVGTATGEAKLMERAAFLTTERPVRPPVTKQAQTRRGKG